MCSGSARGVSAQLSTIAPLKSDTAYIFSNRPFYIFCMAKGFFFPFAFYLA